jgi:putative transposase
LANHRQLPKSAVIKSVTVSQNAAGKYFISVLFDYPYETPTIILSREKVLGLDFDMKHLYPDSQGNKADYPKFYRQALQKLVKEHRRLSKMVRNSSNYQKQKKKLSVVYEKVTNKRNDFLHKLSRQLATLFDVIAIEGINMQTMSKSLNFGKSVHDNSWGKFVQFLTYKMKELGKLVMKVDKWFPSSKKCNNCGHIHKELTLSDRIYKCSNCGTIIDRDDNASRNIREEVIRLLFGNNKTVGTTGLACCYSDQ